MSKHPRPVVKVGSKHVRIEQEGFRTRTMAVTNIPNTYDIEELLLVVNNWNATGVGVPGDFSGNGVVNQPDLDIVINLWGQPVSPPSTGWPFAVEAPHAPVKQITALNPDGCIDLSDINDANVPAQSTTGMLRGITIANSHSSNRCTSNGFTARDTSDYSFYGGGIFNHHHKNLTLSQKAGANQACVRIGGDLVVFENADLDNSQALNDLMRLYGYTDDTSKISRYYLLNCKLRGGILNFGVADGNVNNPDYPKNPTQVWIQGGMLTHGNGQTYAAAISARRRMAQLTITDLSVTGGDRVLDLDDPTPAKLTRVKFAGVLLKQSDVGTKVQGKTQNVVIV